MKTNNLSTKESVFLLYSYVSISAFLVLAVSEITKNIESSEKTLDFNPIVSLVIVLNMVTFASFYFYKKTITQK
jgi:fumarate reductase subunit C